MPVGKVAFGVISCFMGKRGEGENNSQLYDCGSLHCAALTTACVVLSASSLGSYLSDSLASLLLSAVILVLELTDCGKAVRFLHGTVHGP